MSYTAGGNDYANSKVMKHIDYIQVKEMSDQLAMDDTARIAAPE